MAWADFGRSDELFGLYYFQDGTPTHSYMRMLYKYPQAAFPYERLVAENQARGAADREFELVDTGVFAENRYFDVVVEYAKASTDDVLMLVTAHNRGPDAATLHVLPQLWARNVWSWDQDVPRPQIRLDPGQGQRVLASHPALARTRVCEVDGAASWLFCENETNVNRLYDAQQPGPFKDGINDHVVDGVYDAVNPRKRGTKCAAHLRLHIAAGGSATVRLRLRPESSPGANEDAFAWFDAVMDSRRSDCDAFYAAVQRGMPDPDARLVQRQALAGMLWSKQFYMLDVRRWLDGDPAQPAPPPGRSRGRNADWRHLDNSDVISMPDSWEYPWYAAWDLAFHCVTFALIDPVFAKSQLLLLTRERFMHPNGQLPAYEWALGDVNPPGARLGGAAGVPDGPCTDRRGRPHVPAALLPQAAAEFHLVGQPQGRDRAQHLRGRLPRPRQHRHFRPVAPAADGGHDRPIGRHRMDGDVHGQPAAHRARARDRGPRL